jgi:hypothetical protein
VSHPPEADTLLDNALASYQRRNARPRPRRLFPNGWRDAAFASMASFFVLLDAAVLRFLIHMKGLG